MPMEQYVVFKVINNSLPCVSTMWYGSLRLLLYPAARSGGFRAGIQPFEGDGADH